MPERFIPFTNFRPGSPEHGTGLMRADNAFPVLGAWRPMHEPDLGATLAGQGPILGGYCHTYPTGIGSGGYSGDAVTEFWGTRTNLFTQSGGFTSISRGGGYGAGALVPSEWNFASFGNDIWAANGVDALQRRTNNAGNFANGVTSTTFVPVPRFVATVRESLVVGFLNQAGRFADEIAISDVGDATYFDPADANRPASTASNQRVRSRPGQLTGLVGGQYGRIFKARSLHSLIFTGASDHPYEVDEISSTTGTPCGKSIVECSDGFLRFWGGDGFYRQAGTAPPEKISPASLNNLLIEAEMDFYDHAVTRLLPGTMHTEGLRFVGAQSLPSGVVFWLYQSIGVSDEKMTRIVAHDPTSGEWGLINLEGAAGAGYIAQTNGLSYIMSRPINTSQATSLLWDLVGAWTDGTDAKYVRFDLNTAIQATFATQRFSLSEEGEISTSSPRITGILPVASRQQTTGSPHYGLRTLPEGVVIRVIGANDPHFVAIENPPGTQISPRSEVFTRDSDFGWWTGAIQARWFIAEMVYPAGATTERGFVGAYVRWE